MYLSVCVSVSLYILPLFFKNVNQASTKARLALGSLQWSSNSCLELPDVIRKLFKFVFPPPQQLCRKNSTGVVGGLSGGSSVRRSGTRTHIVGSGNFRANNNLTYFYKKPQQPQQFFIRWKRAKVLSQHLNP